jgi:checkpoint serine/threonine-protein kinase
MNMARKQENPGDLFKYLAANEIGQQVAKYYIEYASFKENGGYIREATEIYQQGIKREAQPLEVLKNQYSKFKARTANMPLEPENRLIDDTKDHSLKNIFDLDNHLGDKGKGRRSETEVIDLAV